MKSTAEFDLLIACTRLPSERRNAEVKRTAQNIDWDAVLKLARKHRVQGLVVAGLSHANVPLVTEAGRRLCLDANAIARQGLIGAAESARLVRRLSAENIDSRVLKGSPLAMLAYGSLTTKMAWDIDLIVKARDILPAARTLIDAGYVCILPGPDTEFLGRWSAYSNQSVWYLSARDQYVELHTALVENSLLLRGLDPFSSVRSVHVSSVIALPTLAHEELFAYLCVHGSASGWRRLKWLADFVNLITGASAEELARLYRRSQALGAGRAAGQAFLLAKRVFDLPIPAEIARSIERDRIARVMTWIAHRQLVDPHGYDDPAETKFGTMPIHVSQLFTMPGFHYFLSTLIWHYRADPRFRRRSMPIGFIAKWLRHIRRRKDGSSMKP